MQTNQNNKPLNSFEDVEALLDNLGLFHMDLGLERINKAIKLLNLRFSCPIVQVLGTNGKGSTSTFLHSIAMAHGLKVGLFTSPHFISVQERIRMNNKLLAREAWPDLVNQSLSAVPDLTYFELITVVSLLAFTLAEPNLLIYEAGLGGKNDATTAIGADLLCYTPIELDHKKQLGNNLKDIAIEKSGAISEKNFAVLSAKQNDKVFKVLEDKSKILNIPFYSSNSTNDFPSTAKIENYNCNSLGLKGKHQIINAQTALWAWHLLCEKNSWNFEPKAVEKGLANAFIPGRLQVVDKQNYGTIILDGAHNPHGLKTMLVSLTAEKYKPIAIIFSCLINKEPQNLVEILEKFLRLNKLDIPIYITPIEDNPNAVPIMQLASYFEPSTKVQLTENFEQAFHAATSYSKEKQEIDLEGKTEKPIVICGSLYLLAKYYNKFPEDLGIVT